MSIRKFIRTRKLKHLGLTYLLLLGGAWAQGEKIPAFQVIPVYEGQLAFIEAIQAQPELRPLEKTERYQELALAPYAEVCGAEGEKAFVQSNYGYEVNDLETWKNAVQDLIATDIAGAVEEGVTRSASLLSADPITFCVFALHPSENTSLLKRLGGVTGYTAAGNVVLLEVYPEGAWLEWVAPSVAHEYHHAAWLQRFPDGFDGFQLTDYLILEGRAGSFAELAYPDSPEPWTKALTPDEQHVQWEVLQPHLGTRNRGLQQRIMFGGERYPTWTGYVIGFNIVQSFLKKHPNMDVATWTEMDAQELLERSGYAP